jgi:hypothetical protein
VLTAWLLAAPLMASFAFMPAHAVAQDPLTAQRARPARPSGELSADPAQVLAVVARTMGDYARDISEIPLTVETTVTKFAPGGRQRSTSTSPHSMQFVKRFYNGGQVTRNLQARKSGLHRVSKDEVNGDEATAVLALIFDNGKVSNTFGYDFTEHVISKRLDLKITDIGECHAFDPMIVDHRKWCGEGHLLLDSSTLAPLSATFKAGGFPQAFGNVRYLSFSFEEEFQTVPFDPGSEPLLLPARVVLTYESDKGKTVIESSYSLDTKNMQSARRSGSF